MAIIFQKLNQLSKGLSRVIQVIITYIGVALIYFIGISLGGLFALFIKPKDKVNKWSSPDTTNPLEVMY